jgi:alpha-glucosidase (family GH31 glycosyl hydrolase)
VIRHRPAGRGHAYELDLDQRTPVQPLAGAPLELRATTSRAATTVGLELERNGRRKRLEASPFEPPPPPEAGEGHLAAAASARLSASRRAWRVVLEDLEPSEVLRYRFVSNEGATRWHSVTAASWRDDGGTLVVLGEPSRVVRDTRWLVAGDDVVGVRFAIEIGTEAHVVGFGERFNALDQRGRVIDSVVFEQYKNQGERTYLPMPYALVVDRKGTFGFHVATSRRVTFDVGATAPDRIAVETTVDHQAPELTLRLFAGAPCEVVRQFLEATRVPKLPPDWIFTPWMSANEWNTQHRVETEVDRTFAEDIPAGVVVIEAWSDEETFTIFRDAQYDVHHDGAPHRLPDFSFPADGAWPEPKRMVDRLHERGLRVLLWQIPLLRPTRKAGSQLAADRHALVDGGYAVRQADGRPYANRGWWFPHSLLPDFTSPAARRWWLDKRRYLLEDLGIDGFKTDGGEHAWGDDLVYADGTTGAQTNNLYPQLYASAYHELIDDIGVDAITFSRAGFTGAAASPCHWAGDEDSTWDAFRASITAGLTAGASGVFFWGWDIAGFSGPIPTAELYARATAMACFCPIMQYHSEFNGHRAPSIDRTPWNIAEQTGDRRALDTYRRYAKLRLRLVPYLTAQARRSVESGAPLMRALFFEYSDDEAIWAHPFDYLLGDDLLVSPVVVAGAVERDVYLPDGTWVDLWSGEVRAGRAVVTCAAPLEQIPVHINAQRAPRLRPALLGE